ARRHRLSGVVLAQCRRRRFRRGGAARSRRCRSRGPGAARRRRWAGPSGAHGSAGNRLPQIAHIGAGLAPYFAVSLARLAALAGARLAAAIVTRKVVPEPVEAISTTSPPCTRINSRAIARPSPLPPGRAEAANGRNRFSWARGGRPGP